MLRVGVVGVGRNSGVGLHCVPLSTHQTARLVAVCDQSPERATPAGERFGVRACTSYDEFLADAEIDVVTVATPPFLHAEMVIQALGAGKHVVVEKPMCLSVAEADAMIAAARKADRKLTVFQNRRWDPDYLAIRSLIDEGEVGQPWTIESRLHSGPAYGAGEFRASWFQESAYGGGWLLGWGSHLFDQVLRMVPSRPKLVFASARATVWSKDADDYFKTLIVFENGATAQVEADMSDKLGLPRWYVRGDKGTLRKQTIGADSPVEVSRLVAGTTDGDFTGPARFVDVGPFRREFQAVGQHFYALLGQAIEEGRELAVKPEESRAAMQVIEASFVSSREGRAVAIS